MLRSATIAAALGLSGAAVVNDSVPFLPGLEQALPSALYSGYMEPSRGHFLHYIFMESWNDPATDPVIVWMNGGPGSSSMGGLFTELGPFVTSDESFPNGPDTGPYTVKLNPYTWNANASVIYLEQPAGVGFSYCNPASPCAFNDATQADDTFAFLEKFFEGFPEFKDNEFYLTAESYGGVCECDLVCCRAVGGGGSLARLLTHTRWLRSDRS
jgi:carboxypeptidase C (cathepsin A)